ncbi:MAG: LysR family transcriptional regulator [Acidobacteria bacterium]|nr:LysR family transcriptional regulator [Acidobacteriota bacterium]
MDFDLRQLEIFQKVVELRSISKAAESVCLAQASVSERMATLERMIGTKLLDRIGREIVPTKAGELLYKKSVKHLEMKRQTCLELEEFLGICKGDIEIGGSTIPAEYILPGIIRHFREKYPEVIVKLRIGDSETISRLVSDGKLELGIVGSMVKNKRLLWTELWKDELVLVVNPSHPWTRKRAISLEELCNEPFIQRENGSGTRQIIEQQLRRLYRVGFEGFRVVSQMGSSTAVKEGIRNGLGVSILSSRAVAAEVEAGKMHIIPLKKISLHRSFFLIRDRARTQSPLCRALNRFLQSNAAAAPSR